MRAPLAIIVLAATSLYASENFTFEEDFTFKEDDAVGAYYYYDSTFGQYAIDGCVPGCDDSWLDDGECDETCNAEMCGWDGTDCFNGYGECYALPDGEDYRGTVSVTTSGKDCQMWSHQWPQTHVKTHTNFPASGLGGHNHCRNPDQDLRPWCFTVDETLRWEYCDIPPPSKLPCNVTLEPAPPNISVIALNEMVVGQAAEHIFRHYHVPIAADIALIKIVVVPHTGDPDLYISFDNPLPNGANYTFSQENVGVDVFEIGRENHFFCGGRSQGACTLYLSVLGWESTTFSLIVYGVDKSYFKKQNGESIGETREVSLLCAAGCEWRSLGDGTCNPQCNNTACFWDRGDCTAASTGCPVDCKDDWVGDGYCDEACFNARCHWDHRDCLEKKGEKPCGDYCMPDLLGDGECDAYCNMETCEYDAGDCFHDHDECYQRSDGADYRGRVSTTVNGHECQAWNEQTPQAHVNTHAQNPRAGLGGHNYCRNPDGEEQPWCYTMDPSVRWEVCDVGTQSETPCISPPPPSPMPPAPLPPPPPPPSPSPLAPPPAPCPADCSSLGKNGKCDLPCNTTTCFWDQGECAEKDVLEKLLSQGGLTGLDVSVLGELVASQGGFMRKAMIGGVMLGLVGGICTACFLCYLRRKKRRMQLTNRKYTPYGEADDGDGGPGLDPGGPEAADVIDPDADSHRL